MAGGKIRGITIQLDGDTSGLSKSLQSANKEIKNTQTQLKDVERLLKLDPTNTELLRQKQQLLGQAIGETKTKLDTLKKAEEQMKSQGVDENSEQFMALQREIIATENELKSLEKAADKTTSAFDKVKAATDKVAQGAQKVAQKTKALSAAGAAVAGGLLATGASALQTADELETMSARTGLSTDMLQKLAYASELVDVSTEELSGAVAKMKKNMGDAPDKFEALGIAVKDADGNFRDIEDVFYDSLAALSQIGNETERDLAAMDLFGKSADTLATIIDDGGAGLQEYGQKAQDLGLILSEDTIGKLNETGDTIAEMKARATATFTEMGATLLETLAPTIEVIIEKIGEVVAWLGSLDSDTLNMILTVAMVVAAISPVASIVSGISTAIGGVSDAINWLVANPMVAIAAAVVAFVVLIATKGDEIQALLQKVDDFLQNIFAKDWSEQFGFLGEIMNLFMGVFKGIWDGVKQILDGIIDVIRGVFTGDWDRAWTGVQEILGGVFTAMEGIFDAFSSFLKNIFEKDWSESLGFLGDILNGLFASVSEIWDGIEGIFKGIIDFVKNVFKGDWSAAWESVKQIFKSAFDALVGFAKAPLNLIIGLINGLIDGLNWLVDGINKISFTVPDWVPYIGGKSVGFHLGHIGKIAYLAQGGILEAGSAIVGENGPELLSMLGNRAVVQPLTQNTNNTQNYGGVTLNIYGAAGQNIQELAEIIMDEMGNATRRQEAAWA